MWQNYECFELLLHLLTIKLKKKKQTNQCISSFITLSKWISFVISHRHWRTQLYTYSVYILPKYRIVTIRYQEKPKKKFIILPLFLGLRRDRGWNLARVMPWEPINNKETKDKKIMHNPQLKSIKKVKKSIALTLTKMRATIWVLIRSGSNCSNLFKKKKLILNWLKILKIKYLEQTMHIYLIESKKAKICIETVLLGGDLA